MYSEEEIQKAKEILKDSQNQKINNWRKEQYFKLTDAEKEKLLLQNVEENILLKKLLFDISKNKNYVIQINDSENKNFKNWTYEFLNKDNKSNGKKITIFYSNDLLNKLETLATKDGE